MRMSHAMCVGCPHRTGSCRHLARASRSFLRWLVAFNIIPVAGGGVHLGFCFARLLAGAEASGAEVAAVFNIVVFGQGRNHGSTTADLADTVQNDLRTTVVKFEGAVDFDGAAFEMAHIPNVLQSGREHHDREGASHLILTEVEEMYSLRSYFYFEDFARDAFRFANVLARFVNGNTIRGGQQRHEGEDADSDGKGLGPCPPPTQHKSSEAHHPLILEMTG